MSTTLAVLLTVVGGAISLAIGWFVGLKRASVSAVESVGPSPQVVEKKTEAATDVVATEVAKEEKEIRNAPSGKLIDMARALRERGRMRK